MVAAVTDHSPVLFQLVVYTMPQLQKWLPEVPLNISHRSADCQKSLLTDKVANCRSGQG